MRRIRRTTRTFEMIMGSAGSIIGLISGSLILLIESFSTQPSFLGLIAILASFLAIASSIYVKRDAEISGIGFIMASVFVILGSSYVSILSAIFLLIAGISALFRK